MLKVLKAERQEEAAMRCPLRATIQRQRHIGSVRDSCSPGLFVVRRVSGVKNNRKVDSDGSNGHS